MLFWTTLLEATAPDIGTTSKETEIKKPKQVNPRNAQPKRLQMV
jgi:hypothetical protein